jgi:hypothetical protein
MLLLMLTVVFIKFVLLSVVVRLLMEGSPVIFLSIAHRVIIPRMVATVIVAFFSFQVEIVVINAAEQVL